MTSDAFISAPRTVAWLIYGGDGYGIARAVLGLTGELQRGGWRTPILAMEDGPLVHTLRARGDAVSVLGVPWSKPLGGAVPYPMMSLGRLLGGTRQAERRIAETLAPLNPDALHVLRPDLLGVAARATGRLGLPCVWEISNAFSDRYPLDLNRRLYRFLRRRHRVQALANSRYTAESLGDAEPPVVCHLGVDAARFDPARVAAIPRCELGLPEDAVVLAMVGRLSPARGQHRVLQALLQVGDPSLHLLLVGGPLQSPFAAELQAMAVAAGAGQRLHLVGEVPDPERYYPAADVVVTAYQGPDAFGYSAVEAMMLARPVLAHACGGPAETVLDGVTGWHAPAADAATLAAALRRALADRPRWPALGQAARTHALAHFTLAAQAQRYMTQLNTWLPPRNAQRPR